MAIYLLLIAVSEHKQWFESERGRWRVPAAVVLVLVQIRMYAIRRLADFLPKVRSAQAPQRSPVSLSAHRTRSFKQTFSRDPSS